MNLPTPFSGQNRMSFSRSEYVKGILGTLVFLVIIVGYALELRHFSNTFEVESMIKNALLFGLVVGLIVGFFYGKKMNDLLERFQVMVFFIFVGVLLLPLFASWVNRGFSSSEVMMEQVELQEQHVYSQSRFGRTEKELQPDGYYLFVIKNRKLERLKTKQLLFPKETPKGTIVEIPIKKGGLGYEYFKEP